MASPTEALLERLSQELSPLDPMIRRFCRERGYRDETAKRGHWPRRYLVKREGAVQMAFDLEIDASLIRDVPEHVEAETPMTLRIGAWVGSGADWRVIGEVCFEKMPFVRVVDGLVGFLERGDDKMTFWPAEALASEGDRGPWSGSAEITDDDRAAMALARSWPNRLR